MPILPSASNPDIIDRPHKRHPTDRVTENGDPLVHKKAKTAATTSGTSGNNAPTPAGRSSANNPSMTRRASVEDISESAPTPRAQPHNPNHILEAADGSDDDADMPGLADESGKDSDHEEEPEDDDAELCWSQIPSCFDHY
jgi:hypothetical protein